MLCVFVSDHILRKTNRKFTAVRHIGRGQRKDVEIGALVIRHDSVVDERQLHDTRENIFLPRQSVFGLDTQAKRIFVIIVYQARRSGYMTDMIQ